MKRRILVAIPIILLIAVLGFVVWASSTPEPLAEADAALIPDGAVDVSTEQWLVFEPQNNNADVGFIFYPGGRVRVESYAPPLREIAEQGYLVVGVPMPLNLAVLSPNAAEGVIAAYPDIERWVIGGHSLGGSMAANFAKWHPDAVQGLVLWASYPQASDSLAEFDDLVVASIGGSLDGLAKEGQVLGAAPYLPEDTQFNIIEGGNHAYFGYYGEQAGDNEATITREQQQEHVLATTLYVLDAVRDGGLGSDAE